MQCNIMNQLLQNVQNRQVDGCLFSCMVWPITSKRYLRYFKEYLEIMSWGLFIHVKEVRYIATSIKCRLSRINHYIKLENMPKLLCLIEKDYEIKEINIFVIFWWNEEKWLFVSDWNGPGVWLGCACSWLTRNTA